MDDNTIKIQHAIKKLKEEIGKCNSINEYLDMTCNFQFQDISIKPGQIENEIYVLLQVLSNKQPKVVLEIGTGRGGTLFLLTRVAAPNAIIISIDLPGGEFGDNAFPLWKNPLYESFARKNQQIHLIRSSSQDDAAILKLKKILDGNKIDFLLIDGNHCYENVKADFYNYLPFVNHYGIIVFHDICEGPLNMVGGVPCFWKEIKSKYLHTEIIDNDNRLGRGLGLIILHHGDETLFDYSELLKKIIDVKNTINI